MDKRNNFIRKAILTHSDKYDYSNVEYINNSTKVNIVCPIHGEFKQIPNSHLSGKGCKACSYQKSSTEDFIIKAKEKQFDKYDYSLVDYKTSKTKIKIICPIHGQFEQTPNSHLNGKGCSKCSSTAKLTTEEFIIKAKKIHKNKYDYSKTEYNNMKNKITIICPIHGEFEQESGSHINQKTGCSKCSKKHKYNNKEFIDKCTIIHGNKYDYSNVKYINNYTKIKIICYKHGEFNQTPSNHLSGKGCESCRESKNESLISVFLKNKNLTFIPQHKFIDCKYKRLLPFDFFLPDYNLCIEFNGEQHYKPIDFFGGKDGFIKQQIRDKIKIDYCNDNNIKLLIINFNDDIFNKLNNYCLFKL